jgi:ribokinase
VNGGAAAGRVVVVGSLNVDLVARVERLPRSGETVTGYDLERTPGGKGLNQAVAAARAGVPVVMVGSVGDDDHGRWLRDVASSEGIDVGPVASVAAATGTALITVGGEGANTIVVSPGANGETGSGVPAAVEALALGPGDVVLGQAEIPAGAVVAALTAAQAAGATTMVNQAPFRPVGDDLWGVVDVLIVNETELAEMLATEGGGELLIDEGPAEAAHAAAVASAGRLLAGRPGPGALVVTLGRAGAVVVAANGLVSSVVGREVTAVDTVGAGDCLAGWLAAGVAGGLALGSALERAVVAASLSVQRSGAATAMPHLAEVEQAR